MFSSKIQGKIIIEKWTISYDPAFADVKYEIKDKTTMSIDTHCLADADDVVVSCSSLEIILKKLLKLFHKIEAAVYSKVDGVYNVFVRPDPIHICKVHEVSFNHFF